MSRKDSKAVQQTEDMSEKDTVSKKKDPVTEISKNKMYLLSTVIIGVLLLLDQYTKHLVIQYLKGKQTVVLIKGVLELQYIENTGSAFSLFRGQKMLILTMGVIVLLAAFFFLYKLPADKKFCITHILVTVMIAGALGNMIDRIRHGFVIDFVSFVLIHFPVFNVADCYVVVSAVWLFVLFMFIYKENDLEWIGSVLK